MNRSLLLRLLFALVLPAGLFAADRSDPVGLFRITLHGNSDTMVSLPLQRPPLVETTLASLTGSVLTLSADVPALPAGGAFVLVMSGTFEGAAFPVTAVTGRALTIDNQGLTLTGFKTVATSNVATADLVAVVPYWTLDTLFPAGKGINPSTSTLSRATEILFFDDSQSGVNLAASASYFYFAGNATVAAGWYKVGAPLTSSAGTQRLAPHTYFIVRHNIVGDTKLLIGGGVRMAGYLVPLRLRMASVDQDNFVALPIATPITLGTSRLVESGAFVASASPTALQDQLLVFDNTQIGHNKASSATYFYFAGNASKAAGWYKVGATSQTADSFTLKPGEGYIIRKFHTATAQTNVWTGLPAYLK